PVEASCRRSRDGENPLSCVHQGKIFIPALGPSPGNAQVLSTRVHVSGVESDCTRCHMPGAGDGNPPRRRQAMPKSIKSAVASDETIAANGEQQMSAIWMAWRDEAFRFAQRRLSHNQDAVLRLTKCGNWQELLELQMDWSREILEDYLDESRELFDLVTRPVETAAEDVEEQVETAEVQPIEGPRRRKREAASETDHGMGAQTATN